MEVQAQSQLAHLGSMADKVALLYFVLQVIWFPCQYTSANDQLSYFIPPTINILSATDSIIK